MKKIIVLLLSVEVCLGQLPFQVKPKQRGFPGKRYKGDGSPHKDIIGRGEIEMMYRLNDTFRPSHYDIELRPILDNDGVVGKEFTVLGKVRIVGVNQENTTKIVLHANVLEINESSIKISKVSAPQDIISVRNATEDPFRHFYIVELNQEIFAGDEYEIRMEYEAKIVEAEVGLFYRFYEDENGESRLVAATQLESVEARRLFPCFDEPNLKATFELTVIRKNEFTSLSNTELVSSVPDPQYEGWTIDKFGKTVRMSTYNLALSLTDYGYIERFFGERPSRIYVPQFLIESGGGNYSADVAAKCLSFYETFFNETYKLSKMDSIVIPDFGGAMENWGMNVYGFEYLLHFPGENSETQRTLATMIVAHELAHQCSEIW